MCQHPVVKQIVDLLKSHNVWFEFFKHQPVTTSEEAAAISDGYTFHQGTKAMIIKFKLAQSADGPSQRFAMLVFPADKRFDRHKVKTFFSGQKVSLASPVEIAEITHGVEIGGVPPFGQFFDLEVVADPSIQENEKIIFNAGDRAISIGLKTQDYLKLVKPQLLPIIK